MVCKEGGGGGDCRRRSNVYSTSCDACRARNKKNGVEDTIENVGEYEGETSKSAAERSENLWTLWINSVVEFLLSLSHHIEKAHLCSVICKFE